MDSGLVVYYTFGYEKHNGPLRFTLDVILILRCPLPPQGAAFA